jgi:hypothetical protein
MRAFLASESISVKNGELFWPEKSVSYEGEIFWQKKRLFRRKVRVWQERKGDGEDHLFGLFF